MEDKYAVRAMALIAWMDIFERIDCLILEIRHIQETVASQLRLESFFKVLEHEHKFFWGRIEDNSDWFKELSVLGSIARRCDELADEWCPEIPAATHQRKAAERDRDSVAGLQDARERATASSEYSAIDERLYEALRYLAISNF
jgi:hypothetical protein